ncbi:tellurium resistance protein [Nakamurella flavida]|uniref:Tellurium resistance protein n=1 Tax=Nakamurella flavida TaxID=363630 RepID=A0A938YN52_9ACTN|nr:tellurium resistance protein [Nakamurella flavida]MBM9476427.1 tellurium resistance protein [Nakamurella flavida]MDP9779472.1 tellurite resistance protein TerA [Nakamurella flavida]
MAIDYTKRPTTPPPAAAPPPAAGGGAPVSLSKVTLTKSAPRVSLSKTGGTGGVLTVNLNWSARPPAAPDKPRGGFLAKLAAAATAPAKGIDLDLGCLYELADGRKGVIQALGGAFGSLDEAPWIALDGDDRSGSVTGGETMSVNLGRPGRFKRVLIFAMIYEGVPNWGAADGVVTLTPVGGPQIEVTLDATEASARICAVAQLTDNGGELEVQREVQYVNGGQSVLDKMYGWGMQWAPGRK